MLSGDSGTYIFRRAIREAKVRNEEKTTLSVAVSASSVPTEANRWSDKLMTLTAALISLDPIPPNGNKNGKV